MQIVLFLLFILCHPLIGMEKNQPRKPSLGVKTLHYHDETRDRPIVVEFWYPTDRQGPVEAAPLDSLWIHPNEVRNAPLRKSTQKYSLIAMSHGYRGGRRDLSWLAEKFVQQGYVVAAVDHFGDTRARFQLLTSIRFWERPRDISFMIDSLEKEETLTAQIDFDRIGFLGYSMGGMTGLALAGAQAQNVREVVEKVNGKFREFPPELLEQFDFSEGEKSYRDPRISAMVLLCPATYVYPASSLNQIEIPVGLVAAVGDDVLPFQDHAFRLIQHLIPKKLKVLREEISHYAFMNRLTEAGKKALNIVFSNDHPCCSRSSIHTEVGTFSLDFFAEVLKKRKE